MTRRIPLEDHHAETAPVRTRRQSQLPERLRQANGADSNENAQFPVQLDSIKVYYLLLCASGIVYILREGHASPELVFPAHIAGTK